MKGMKKVGLEKKSWSSLLLFVLGWFTGYLVSLFASLPGDGRE